MNDQEIWGIVIGYTCVGIFVATAIITILALVGLIKLQETHFNRLFTVLIIEVVVVGVGFFAGTLNFDVVRLGAELEAGQQANDALFALEADITDPTVTPTPPPRIYIHISDEAQRVSAEAALTALRKAGDLVPGIENVGERSPDRTELRYFRSDELANARELTEVLATAGVEASPKFVEGLEANIRPLHFELWFEDKT